MAAVLERAPTLGVRNWWLTAGVLFPAVWNELTGRPPSQPAEPAPRHVYEAEAARWAGVWPELTVLPSQDDARVADGSSSRSTLQADARVAARRPGVGVSRLPAGTWSWVWVRRR